MLLPEPFGPTTTIGSGAPLSASGRFTRHVEMGPVFSRWSAVRYMAFLRQNGLHPTLKLRGEIPTRRIHHFRSYLGVAIVFRERFNAHLCHRTDKTWNPLQAG